MTELPAPPVPADADLRDFPFTPIYRARLFGSSFHARASDAEWRAGFTLWLKCQDQVPAGSLPDDDVDLCRLAELGRDLRTFRKLRAGALHGWYKCSDGRLYHPVVSETVNEQWQGKIAQRERTLKARIAALEKRIAAADTGTAKDEMIGQWQALRHQLYPDQIGPVASPVTETKREGERQGKGKGEGKGERDSKKKNSDPSDRTRAASSSPPVDVDKPVDTMPTAATLPLAEPAELPPIPLHAVRPEGDDWRKALFRQGLDWLARASGKSPATLRALVGQWLKLMQDDARALFDLFAEAESKELAEPVAWLMKACAERAGSSGKQQAAEDDAKLRERVEKAMGRA